MKLCLIVVIATDICTVTVVTSWVTLASADCKSGAEACTQTYVADAINFRTKDDICGGAQTFIFCYKKACGSIPAAVVTTMQNKIGAAGIQCDLHA